MQIPLNKEENLKIIFVILLLVYALLSTSGVSIVNTWSEVQAKSRFITLNVAILVINRSPKLRIFYTLSNFLH